MTIEITSQARQLIDDRLRSGQYQSAEQVVEEALQLLASREEKLAELRAMLKVGLDQADRGECKPLDFDALRARLHAEHAQRTGNGGNGNGAR